MNQRYNSLAHSKWDCVYHLIFIPKKRQKKLFLAIRKYLVEIFHELAGFKECKIISGNILFDHVHMCISIPPKYAVASIVGYLKGKSAIAVARRFQNTNKNFNGHSFWARGYAVSTVGFEVQAIKQYIKNQTESEMTLF